MTATLHLHTAGAYIYILTVSYKAVGGCEIDKHFSNWEHLICILAKWQTKNKKIIIKRFIPVFGFLTGEYFEHQIFACSKKGSTTITKWHPLHIIAATWQHMHCMFWQCRFLLLFFLVAHSLKRLNIVQCARPASILVLNGCSQRPSGIQDTLHCSSYGVESYPGRT